MRDLLRYNRINLQLSEREEKAVRKMIERAHKSGYIALTPTHALRTLLELGIQQFEKQLEKTKTN
jgi:hypothetical protein